MKFSDQVERLKRAVARMIAARNAETRVDFWQATNAALAPLMEMSAESLRGARFHAGWIVGEAPAAFWHPIPPHDPETYATGCGYRAAISRLPERLWIGEEPAQGVRGALGVEWRRHVINPSITRYQRVIQALWQNGFFETENPLILEIGGGYGGLAHHLRRLARERARYVLVDLPETLFVSGCYLALNNPDCRISVSGEPDFTLDADFCLVEAAALDEIASIEKIDAAINTCSFDEMSAAQVERYLDFIAPRAAGILYSKNASRHPYNREMTDVNAMIASRFSVISQGKPECANEKSGYSGLIEIIAKRREAAKRGFFDRFFHQSNLPR